MSSFLAKLEMDGENYNVLRCKYSFNKETDDTGKPLGSPKGGRLQLTIESDGKSVFIDWMLASQKTKNGSIIFYRRDAMSRLQEVSFEKAYCIEFTEEFDAVNDTPMQITLLITSKNLVISDVPFENNWKII